MEISQAPMLVALFLFALGVPRVFTQVLVEDALRSQAYKYLILPWSKKMVAGVIGIVGINQFLLAPETSIARGFENFSAPYESQRESWEWTAWLLLIMITVVVLYGLFGNLRERLLKTMSAQLLSSYISQQYLRTEIAKDIIIVGELGHPGYHKARSLSEIRGFLEKIRSEDSYRGNGLGVLLDGIPDIILSKVSPGTDKNLKLAMSILMEVRAALRDSDLVGKDDWVRTTSALERLVNPAIDSNDVSTGLRFLQNLNDLHEIRFQVGLRALKTSKIVVALQAANELESNYLNSNQDNNARNLMLGINALIWATGGIAQESTQERIGRFFSSESEKINACELAEKHFSRAANYEVADALRSLNNRFNGHDSIKKPCCCRIN